MNIYWRQKDIPQLKGLSSAERHDAKSKVLGQVWKHWQVWLPFVIQVIVFLVVINLVPQFPYRFLFLLLFIYLTSRIAALPFHHYLEQHLRELIPKGKRANKG